MNKLFKLFIPILIPSLFLFLWWFFNSVNLEQEKSKIIKNITVYQYSDDDTELMSLNGISKQSFNYDCETNHNNLISDRWEDPNGNLHSKIIYDYDYNNNLIEEAKYISDGNVVPIQTITYEYDSNHNLIKENEYHPNESLKHKLEYKYDSNNNLIEEYSTSYTISGGNVVPIKTITYEYDSNNNLIETVSDHSLWGGLKRTYKYDSNNNLIEEAEYDGDENLSWKTYKYDSNHNLIEQLEWYRASNTFPDGSVRTTAMPERNKKIVMQYEYYEKEYCTD